METNIPPKKPSLSDVGDALDDGDEVMKSLYHMFKKLDKEYLQAKRQKISDFFTKL